MKRRDVLKTMAVGLPAATALGSRWMFAKAPAASNSSSIATTTLNLMVEGPFLCLLQNSGAEILAPLVDQHLYTINHQAAEAGTYRLEGVTGVQDTRQVQYVLPEGAEAFRLSLQQLHLRLQREQQPYFSFVVPLPRQIVAVVSRPAEIIDGFGRRRKVEMPTAYAFVYDVGDAQELRLKGYEEWEAEKRLGREAIANLSITTGLPMGAQDEDGEHARKAQAAMRSYLPGLKLRVLDVGAERQTAQLAGYPGAQPRTAVEDCRSVGGIIIPLPLPSQPQPSSPAPSPKPKK